MPYSTCINDWTRRLAILLVLGHLCVAIVPGSNESDSKGENTRLVMATHGALYLINITDPDPHKHQVADGLGGATAVDYDMEKNILIWSDIVSDKVYSISMDGTNKKVIAEDNIMTPDGLSLDWIHENVYWTDTGTNKINVVSLDGSLRKVLFSEGIDEPRAIVVNPLEGWMFWSDWGAAAKIERSGMDGTHRSAIVTEGLTWPNGLAIDIEGRRIYWADASVDNLKSSDYDGSNVEVVIGSSSRLAHPFGLDVFQDMVYWSDWGGGSIYKAHKATGSNISLVVSGFSSPMGIRILHSSKHPKGTNYCQISGECSHLCLPAPRVSEDSKNFTCACPDGMVMTDNQQNCTIDTATPAPTTSAPCQYDPSFTCANGRCIRKQWVCDGDNDCRDNSDEQNCDRRTTTAAPPGVTYSTSRPCGYNPAFVCADGKCIRRHWRCDGDNDCDDNSDEQNCDTYRRPTTTTADILTTMALCPYDPAFTCVSGGCVKLSWRCDGDKDCDDNSDEEGCFRTTTQFDYNETIIYVTETEEPMTSTARTHAGQQSYLMNETTHGLREESGDSGRIAGTVFGILAALIVVVGVAGFYIYKQHLRRHTIRELDNPVYQKQIDELPDSKLPKEHVILPI